MASFLNKVNKLAKNFTDQHDNDQAKQAEANSDSPSKGVKLSLEKAPREDLIDFIKKQAVHTKKVESRLTELLEAYKKVSKEKSDIKTEFDDLNNKYKLLCGSKAEGVDAATEGEHTESTGEVNSEGPSPTHRGELEKLVGRLEREREDLLRQLAEAQESARAQGRGADLEAEEHKAKVKQLNEKLNETNHGADSAMEEKIKQLNEKFAEEQERILQIEKEKDELQIHLDAANVLVATLQKECDEAKDTFNILQRKAEDDKVAEGRKIDAAQEELQSSFQVERDLLKGEMQKLMQEATTNAENFKQERAKLEEEMLNVELERRTLEEKLEEFKDNGEALVNKEWEEEREKLINELGEERDRSKKLAEDLAWERERKDTFDKRLEGIENSGESERNRTLESEKRQLELKIKDLEEAITAKETEVKRLEEEQQKSTDSLVSEKARWEEALDQRAKEFQEEKEKLENGLSSQTKAAEEAQKAKDETVSQLESTVQKLELDKAELALKLQVASSDSEEVQEFLEKIGEEKHILAKDVERLGQMLEEAKAEGKEMSTKLGAVTQQLEESKQRLADERSNISEAATTANNQLEELKETKTRLEAEVADMQAQVKSAAHNVEQIENEKAELMKMLSKSKLRHGEERSESVTSPPTVSSDSSARVAELEDENSKLRVMKVELDAQVQLMRRAADKSKQEHALMLSEQIQKISMLEQKVNEQENIGEDRLQRKSEGRGSEEGESEQRVGEGRGSEDDSGKLRNDLSEKEAELFQLRQEMYEKDKAVLESKALLEQSMLQQSQLREDIADKDEQITHLREAQDIQMKSITSSVATAASEKELAEKLNKYRQLLLHAQNHITEHKRKLSDKQSDVFEYQKKVVSLNEEIEKLKSDKTKYSEQNFNQLQKNYEQHCRTSKLRIDSLDQQLQSTSKDLNTLRNEYDSYKKRAASALKTAAPAAAPSSAGMFTSTSLTRASDQEHLIRSLAQEIDSLKAGRLELEETKMHVYKLETDNAQLSKQVRQFTEQAAEFNSRLKNDSSRLSDEKQELSIRLSAQKDDLQQQLNLLQFTHKSLVKEKDERISVLEYQVKLLQEESNIKAGTIQKLHEQMSDSQSSPSTPRSSSGTPSSVSPRMTHLQQYYSDDPAVHEEEEQQKSSPLARRNSSLGSANDDSPHSRPTRNMPRNSVDAGDQILYYAQLQALREEELAKSHTKIKEMNNALSEAERMEKLHHLQEQVLKKEIRELQRAQKRESTNPEYLKNVLVKYIEFEDQQESLLPVISTLLQLTPLEVKRLEEKRKARYSLLSKVWGK